MFTRIWGLLRYRSHRLAYRENPFEREAYANQSDLGYLDKRSLWSWTGYVRKCGSVSGAAE